MAFVNGNILRGVALVFHKGLSDLHTKNTI